MCTAHPWSTLPRSMRCTRAISRRIRRREYSSACPPGRVRSTSRSIALRQAVTATARAPLHLLEQMSELPADRNFVLASLERQRQMPEFIAFGESDVRRIDHRAAVNLPEDLFVE